MAIAINHFLQALLDSGESKAVIERRLAEYALGIVAALRSGGLTVEQACEDLFNLDNLRMVRRRRLQPALSELLEWDMELEDVAEMAPDGLSESLDAMTRLAGQVVTRPPAGKS